VDKTRVWQVVPANWPGVEGVTTSRERGRRPVDEKRISLSGQGIELHLTKAKTAPRGKNATPQIHGSGSVYTESGLEIQNRDSNRPHETQEANSEEEIR
jgi:hypothetical protein